MSPCSSPRFRQDCRKNSTVPLRQSPFNVNGWMKGRMDGWKASFRPRRHLCCHTTNCCSIPFKSAPALLLHPRLFLPPQEPKLLACVSLTIFSYCPSGLKGNFTTSSLYLATVRPIKGKLHSSFTICNI
jgi:hypothetical protein